MNHIDLNAYQARIGHAGPLRADLATLRELHRLHPQAIAFENLDPLLRRPMSLDADALQRKLVAGGRGGWCFEQNLLFLHVLRAIGFEARGLASRVLWMQPAGALGPRSHMLLAVRLDGEDWIADVGFGGLTLTAPLRLQPGVAQPTPHEPARLLSDGDGYRLEVQLADDWQPVYRFDLQTQELPDYEVTHWYLCHHPGSRFVNGLMAARPLPGLRHALLDNQLTTHRPGQPAQRRALASAAELRDVLADLFGLTLPAQATDDGAALNAALQRLVG